MWLFHEPNSSLKVGERIRIPYCTLDVTTRGEFRELGEGRTRVVSDVIGFAGASTGSIHFSFRIIYESHFVY